MPYAALEWMTLVIMEWALFHVVPGHAVPIQRLCPVLDVPGLEQFF